MFELHPLPFGTLLQNCYTTCQLCKIPCVKQFHALLIIHQLHSTFLLLYESQKPMSVELLVSAHKYTAYSLALHLHLFLFQRHSVEHLVGISLLPFSLCRTQTLTNL
ncbi:hypothetical protein YC2023_051567 [Brassica napus]